MSKAVPVTITRGENKGKSITYHNVVRRWIKVGEMEMALPRRGQCRSLISRHQRSNQVAVIIQQERRRAGSDACRGDGATPVKLLP